MIRFVDLFAGIGGIRLGFEQAMEENGIASRCVFSSEIDRAACETYEANFGEKPAGDIRTVEHLPECDVLLAGFPCQAFSHAGKQRGFADTRGTLFFEIERLLKAARARPSLLLLENVRGFLTHDSGRTFSTVKVSLEELGYHVEHLVLNSSNFNVPQNRVRVYIIATLSTQVKTSIVSDLGASDSHSFKRQNYNFWSNGQAVVGDILESNPAERFNCSDVFLVQLKKALGNKAFTALHGVRLIDYRGGNSIHSWDLGTKGECSSEERALMNAIINNRRKKIFGSHQDGKRLSLDQIGTFWKKPNLSELLESLTEKGYLKPIDGKFNPVCGNMSFEIFKFLDPDSISITVVSSDAHRLGIVDRGVPRRVTTRECARLQGFPDSFVLHPNDSRAYHQIGNSVSVPVVRAIINDVVENQNKPFGGAKKQVSVPILPIAKKADDEMSSA